MLIVGNWKAYVEDEPKVKKLHASAKTLTGKHEGEIVIAPPAPYIGLCPVGKSSLKLASQDLSATIGGAETGEITAGALASLGVSYAILGHSERRARGETDAVVAEKARHALAHGIAPILCVGETERDPDARYLGRIREQITAVFAPLSQKERMQIVVAYEPVWAIGKSAAEAITPADLTEMTLYIRKVLGDFLPGKGNARVRVLYGGSVDAGNARHLAAGSGIDGFLVGRASTDAAAFSALAKAVA
jgi:triosephosphate isomerase